MDFIDFTLFNVFLNKPDFKSNIYKIYLICSIQNEPINENDLEITINKTSNYFYKKIIKDNHEPILIFIYNFTKNNPNDESQEKFNFTIKYKKNKLEYNRILNCKLQNNILIKSPENTIQNIQNNFFLTITTLFKNDFNLFPIYYKYYKSQGVEHFYLYYNNNIDNLDIKFKEYINTLNDVTLTEWNFRYLNDDKATYKHHAQLGQIHDALYRFGKNNSKYMIFNDFDEYFKIKGITIKNYLLNNPNVSTFGFCNRWSSTTDNKIPEKLPNIFLYGNKHDHGDRSKNIFKVEDIETTGIHGYLESITYNIVDPLKILNLDMFHFYSWSNKKRTYDTPYIYKFTNSSIKKKLLIIKKNKL